MIKDNRNYVKFINNKGLFCSVFFLLLGLLNPASKLDEIATFSMFGLLLLYFLDIQKCLMKVKIYFALVIMICSFFLVFLVNNKYDLLFVLAGAFLGMVLFGFYKKFFRDKLEYFIVVIIGIFLITAFWNAGDLRHQISVEPIAGTYVDDKLSFLRVAYLVRGGLDYYAANEKAILEDGRIGSLPLQVWGWRMPTYAYLWAILPGNVGLSTHATFLLLTCVYFLISFRITKLFIQENYAILVPYLAFPYFHYAARTLAFLEIEWWSVIIFVVGIYFLFLKKLIVSVVLLGTALFLRELYVVSLIFMASVYFLERKIKYYFTIVFIGIMFLLFWFVHLIQVTRYVDFDLNLLAGRGHPFGTFLLQQTLAYGAGEYLIFEYRPFLILVLLSFFSFCSLLFKRKLELDLKILGVSGLTLILAVLKIGTTPNDDYWGAIFMPIIFILAPALLFGLLGMINEKKL